MHMIPCESPSILVPIISLQECERICRYHSIIINKNICTYDINGEKGGSYGNSGGPLVVDRQLVGVYSGSKAHANPEYPDFYVGT